MKTKFDEWWENQGLELFDMVASDRGLAEKVWHAAQEALVRTLSDPPHVPKCGEMVVWHSLCSNPHMLGKPCKITNVEQVPHYYVQTVVFDPGDFNGWVYTNGILGEVEPAPPAAKKKENQK